MSETVKVEDRVAHWQQVVHALAKEKGWHDEPAIPRRFQMLGNVMVEVGEMWEEARAKDFVAGLVYYRGVGGVKCDYALTFGNEDRTIPAGAVSKDHKPEGFSIEMADVVIRVLDTAGALGIELKDTGVWASRQQLSEPSNHDLWWQMTRLMSSVARLIEEAGDLTPDTFDEHHEHHDVKMHVRRKMFIVIARCEAIAKVAGVDLWRAVEIKHAFNTTRERRHGGKRS